MQNVWFVLAVILFILEILTPGVFFFGCLAIGAAAAGLCALFYENIIIPWLVFIVVSVGSIYFIRPVARKYLKSRKKKSNVDAIVGVKTIVIEKITPAQMGLVKIDGEFWRASSQDIIDVGEEVEVSAVEGTHLVVKKLSEGQIK